MNHSKGVILPGCPLAADPLPAAFLTHCSWQLYFCLRRFASNKRQRIREAILLLLPSRHRFCAAYGGEQPLGERLTVPLPCPLFLAALPTYYPQIVTLPYSFHL